MFLSSPPRTTPSYHRNDLGANAAPKNPAVKEVEKLLAFLRESHFPHLTSHLIGHSELQSFFQ